jgi:hypothetical protein
MLSIKKSRNYAQNRMQQINPEAGSPQRVLALLPSDAPTRTGTLISAAAARTAFNKTNRQRLSDRGAFFFQIRQNLSQFVHVDLLVSWVAAYSLDSFFNISDAFVFLGFSSRDFL